jgi:methionyl-tRNA formyltransferase
MGTAEIACPILARLHELPGARVVGVVTQPDRPKGRDLKLQASAVKQLALKLDLPVLQPDRARNPEFIERLRALSPELVAVAAYGQILPQSLLDLPRFGCLNVHTSLLPKYRGAAPIQWAILNGDSETGVTIMKMDAGLDTGDILTQEAVPIGPRDTAQTVHDRLAQVGAGLLARTIPDWVNGRISARPQDHRTATHAPKIKKEDGCIDWRLPAETVWNRIRGLLPWPGAFTFLPNTRERSLVKIWDAEPVAGQGAPGQILGADHSGIAVGCGEGALRILELQREGGKRMLVRDFLLGNRVAAGEFLKHAPGLPTS